MYGKSSETLSWYIVELLIGLAGPLWTRESESNFKGLILKLGSSSVGLASPRVPASPRVASPQVQRVGLVPALVHRTFGYLNLYGHMPKSSYLWSNPSQLSNCGLQVCSLSSGLDLKARADLRAPVIQLRLQGIWLGEGEKKGIWKGKGVFEKGKALWKIVHSYTGVYEIDMRSV